MAHGVTITEVPTGVVPAVTSTAGTPVYVGTAMVNAGDPTFVNKPGVFYTLAEAEETLGPVTDTASFNDWTLMQAVKAHFSTYSVAPIVCINVLDPANGDHTLDLVTEPSVIGADGTIQIEQYGGTTPLHGVVSSSVVVRYLGVAMNRTSDYTLTYDDDGYCVITRVAGGGIPAGATVVVSCSYLDPSAIGTSQIIGGYSAGSYTGLEVVQQVFPRLRLVPGLIVAPRWSEEPTVAARMAVIAGAIDGGFKAIALVDLPSDPYEIASYSGCSAWKSDNGYTDDRMIVSWPKVRIDLDDGFELYSGSVVLACVINRTDYDHNGLPYASPSNKAITLDSAQIDYETDVYLTQAQANALNDQGIVTFINGFNGWRTWGNRTGGYPNSSDPKDTMIPVRRMFDYVNNTLILTTARLVDEPGNRRLIDQVLGTVGSFINGLIASEALVDGKVEFREEDNPVADLADGTIRWHLILTPPSPAQEIEYTLEYDPNGLTALFE